MKKVFLVCLCFMFVLLPGRVVSADSANDADDSAEDMIGQELAQADVEARTLEDGNPETEFDELDDDGTVTQANAEQAALESGGNEDIVDTDADDEIVSRADAEAAHLDE